MGDFGGLQAVVRDLGELIEPAVVEVQGMGNGRSVVRGVLRLPPIESLVVAKWKRFLFVSIAMLIGEPSTWDIDVDRG